jgi:hypothetical protein
MTKRPARVTQAEIDRAIRAVKKAGATSFDIVIEEARIIVRVPGNPLAPDRPVADSEEIVL